MIAPHDPLTQRLAAIIGGRLTAIDISMRVGSLVTIRTEGFADKAAHEAFASGVLDALESKEYVLVPVERMRVRLEKTVDPVDDFSYGFNAGVGDAAKQLREQGFEVIE